MDSISKIRTRTGVFLTIILMAAMLIMAPIAGADGSDARRIDVISNSSFMTTDLATNWVDDAGIWHIRGAVAKHEISGDIQSLATVILNADIDLATGNGDLNGYAIWHDTTLVGYELSGGFEGQFSGEFSGWVYEISTVYRGYDGFKQTKLFLTITGQEPTEHHEGFIIGPRFE